MSRSAAEPLSGIEPDAIQRRSNEGQTAGDLNPRGTPQRRPSKRETCNRRSRLSACKRLPRLATVRSRPNLLASRPQARGGHSWDRTSQEVSFSQYDNNLRAARSPAKTAAQCPGAVPRNRTAAVLLTAARW